MGRKYLTLASALLLALCLNACGSRPGTVPPPSGDDEGEDSPLLTPASPDDCYWTAVRHESYNPSYGRTEVSTMPTEKWWADLVLDEDGTAQFREVLGLGYTSCLRNGQWWLGADNVLRLTGEDYDGELVTMDGRMEKDRSVMLETPYGDRFYFEPAQKPDSGGELCIADLEGTWRMTGGEPGAGEKHMASLLNIERRWSDGEEGGYILRAEYYSARLLDTDTPQYETQKELLVEKREEALSDGFSGEPWSARLFSEESGAEYLAALTERNTLYLRRSDAPDGAPTVYTRSDGFLPETLTLALADEPDDALIFYWRDPPAEVAQPLEALPMTALEKGGQNRILLVGRWYETDIQFCTGSAEQNEDGTLGEWLTDTVLYEGTLGIDEPQWFSLSIPEKNARLCLFMKRPWDESWFTWPITDQDPFLVSGNTFLTETE